MEKKVLIFSLNASRITIQKLRRWDKNLLFVSSVISPKQIERQGFFAIHSLWKEIYSTSIHLWVNRGLYLSVGCHEFFLTTEFLARVEEKETEKGKKRVRNSLDSKFHHNSSTVLPFHIEWSPLPISMAVFLSHSRSPVFFLRCIFITLVDLCGERAA